MNARSMLSRNFVVGSLCVMGFMMAGGAEAQSLVYSCKFVCGPITSDADVVRGMYATSCNIHNPNHTTVQFRKKAVIALPERTLPRGRISPFVPEALNADEAMGVDCRDIRGLFGPIALPAHIEGFLVLERPATPAFQLDVVGKYTARHTGGALGTNDVESIHMEQYQAKKVP